MGTKLVGVPLDSVLGLPRLIEPHVDRKHFTTWPLAKRSWIASAHYKDQSFLGAKGGEGR